jgi:2,3-bisphosphoglycerate-independent phosphoglycerate mutase
MMKRPDFDPFFRAQVTEGKTKIAMLILDGLGGLPREPGGKTELETACKPNLDQLAFRSSLGLTIPVGHGITNGSGPGHLAIFGYNPIEYEIGRGVLEALGADFELGPDDLAARGNFCSVDESGNLTDRRAGRLPTEESVRLVEILRQIKIEGVELFVEPVKEHRFAFIMRSSGLGAALTDNDPLKTGVHSLEIKALDQNSQRSAAIANEFLSQAARLLTNQYPANGVLLRGFSKFPTMPQYMDIFKLHAAAVAVNGMYRGVARLVGMDILDIEGATLTDEFNTLEKNWKAYDFFYLHFKKTDTCGESGDFEGKVNAIEEFDAQLPRLLALNPDVIIIGGDHSSPAIMKSHSWHPVPLMIYSRWARPEGIAEFGERACARGCLGMLPAKDVMPIALANAGRVAKYGA